MSLFDRLAAVTEAKGQQSRAGRFQATPGDAYQHTDWRMAGARNKAGTGDFAGKNKRYPAPANASPRNWARAAGALRALDMHNPPDKAAIAKKIKKRFGLKCVKAAGDADCHPGDPGGGPEGGKKYQGGSGDPKQDKAAKSKKADHNQGYPWPFYHTGEKKYDPGWTQLSKAHAQRAEKRGEREKAKAAKGAAKEAATQPAKGQKKLKKAEKKAAVAGHAVAKQKHRLAKRATQFARPDVKAKVKAKAEKAQAGMQQAITKGKAKKTAKAAKKVGKAATKQAKVQRIGKRRKRATKAASQQGF